MSTPALIALDWGTTSLRAYLLGDDGRALDTRTSSAGIMKLPPEGGFDQAFEETCGAWLDANARGKAPLPVVAAGMVGSTQGWVEAPYVETPAGADALVAGIVTVTTARGVAVNVVPGVLERGTLPNVMRGEETQIFGALASDPSLDAEGSALIGLPGTHAKWAFVRDGRIERFYTFMTGETFGALRGHTILGRTMHPSATHDESAFIRGVDTARDAGHPGMLATIFSTRTLGLTGQLSAEQQADYLSGLLIGHELRGLNEVLARENAALAGKTLALIGNDALCDRYRAALARFGCDDAQTVAHATERGLYRIAAQAGLVSAPVRAA